MATVQPVQRVFEHDELSLPDPDPSLTPDEVRSFYGTHYPTLTTATVSGPEMRDGKEVYTFKRSVGTKG